MKTPSRVSLPWPILAVVAIALLAAGAGAAYVGLRARAVGEPAATESREAAGSRPPVATLASPTPASSSLESAVLPDVVVPLSEESAARAGITKEKVTVGSPAGGLHTPAVIEANSYKQVVVTPIVGGRITRVAADLGQHVRRGETLAQIFSPELAEWQTRYISTKAELQAHEQELDRTRTLVEIGAASRQELERVHAGHTARQADLESAASRLQLLGLLPAAIAALGPGKNQEALTSVPAPMAGLVTARTANVGLNVEQATPLFTVTDLSSVWVVANLYEQDFARVRVGSPATVRTKAYPDLVLQGRVSYIDPQVSPETRTARVRIEVPNADNALRLGMYAEATFGEGASPSTPTIPRSAVQHVGDRTVVYLVDAAKAGQFVERDVRLGAAAADRVSVLAGVRPGDVVVAEGSFSVRAERERLGLRAASPPVRAAAPSAGAAPRMGAPDATEQEVRVAVLDASFEPQRVTVRAGVPTRLTFTRTSEKTCATAVVFPSINIKRELPLNVPVAIVIRPEGAGELAFACGMNMLHGTVVVVE